MMFLKLIEGECPVSGPRIELIEGQHLIGRSSHCHITIPSQRVSKFHAELIVRGGRAQLRDLGSVNGIHVDGVRRARCELHPGVRVDLGGSVFECGSAPAAAPTMSADTIEGDTWLREREHYFFDLDAPPPAEREALVREHRRLQIFVSGLATMAQTHDVDEIAANILDAACELVPADAGSVLFVAPSGKLEILRSVPRGQPPTIRFSRTALDVVLGGESFLALDAPADERLKNSASIAEGDLRSLLCVPLAHGGRVIGILYLTNSSVPNAFDSDDLKLLASLGTGAGMALHIAQSASERLRNENLAAVGLAMTSVAHHMRNVIQAMIAPVRAISRRVGELDDGPIDAAATRAIRKLVPILESGTARMNESLESLLAFSRTETIELQEGSINDLVREVADQAHDRAEALGIRVECDLDDEVPRSAIDQVRLHDLLLNLVGNAIDAIVRSGQGESIRLRTSWSGEVVTVEVADDGPGMTPEIRDKAFSAFFTTKGSEGSGLGLAIARKIAIENDGRLSLETRPGQGATFRLELPLRRPAPA